MNKLSFLVFKVHEKMKNKSALIQKHTE